MMTVFQALFTRSDDRVVLQTPDPECPPIVHFRHAMKERGYVEIWLDQKDFVPASHPARLRAQVLLSEIMP